LQRAIRHRELPSYIELSYPRTEKLKRWQRWRRGKPVGADLLASQTLVLSTADIDKHSDRDIVPAYAKFSCICLLVQEFIDVTSAGFTMWGPIL